MTEVKKIVKILDKAAMRSSSRGLRAASGKQCYFLASLMAKSGETEESVSAEFELSSAYLSSEIASDLIAIQLGEY